MIRVDIKWGWIYNSGMLKRYLLFAFDNYYPSGGWSDFRGDFETLEEALEASKGVGLDVWDIVDSETKKVIA